ncbi:hypothetical protein [Brevibacillus sp. HD1.4A]|uniref:hypothetical protein n=1 Tax=Brevibacillus sp. HD1.4A TaxID=2738978 RepID=UPI001C2CAE78|nr:hypothetical protein [Brevibacillus sp. HD1.4A]
MGKPLLVDAAAVGQAIKTKLLLLKEEWWEQKEDGLPLFQNILGNTNTSNLQAVDLLVQERILVTPNVSRILDFESRYQSRTYSFQCKVETTFGATVPVTYAF